MTDHRTVTVETLAAAMSDSFTYEDSDNSRATMIFVDDIEGFWLPFAARVFAALPATPEAPDHEHHWIDAPEDETLWHCSTCGRTECRHGVEASEGCEQCDTPEAPE